MALPKQNNIRWTRSDYITLGKAVAVFNRKINELNAEEKKLYLPDIISYAEVKENITTRNELNRVLNSLRRFSKSGAEDLYITEGGQEITKWEKQELNIQRRIAKKRINREIKELNEPISFGFSRAQMGSDELHKLENTLKSLDRLENLKGYEFDRIARRIKKLGTSDFTLKKAYIYQENYLKEMEKYSHYDNYDLLMKKLYSIKNPITFYNYVSKNELVGDLTYQSDQYYTQQEFNRFLENFEDIEEIENMTDSIS